MTQAEKAEINGSGKYLVISLTQTEGEIMLIAGGAGFKLHQEILDDVCRRYPNHIAKALGGGKIKFFPDQALVNVEAKAMMGALSISGCSVDFGTEKNRDITAKILTKAYPEWKINAIKFP